MNRRPPADVRRQLRQEVNFGCAVCGAPVIQYHHIDPFSEEEHHDPERMIALCPNHHQEAGPEAEALTPDQLYEYKENPENIDAVSYDFYFESEESKIVVGGNEFILRDRDQMTVMEVNGKPLLEIGFDDGILEFSATMYNENGVKVSELDHNEWWADTNEIWDLTYRSNHFKLWHEKRDIGIEVEYDSSADVITMRGSFYYGGKRIDATPSKLQYPGRNITVTDMSLVDTEVGVSLTHDAENESFRMTLG